MNFQQIIFKIKILYLQQVWFRRGLFGLAGAILGYGYYFYVGCYNGACMISGNPYISTIYGAGIGLLVAPSMKKTD